MTSIVEGARDTEAAARIRKAVWRWIVVEPETIQHFRATWPRFRDWLRSLMASRSVSEPAGSFPE